MSALVFRLRQNPPERLDLSPLVPQRLATLTLAEIERLAIGTTRHGLVVGDLFQVTAGDATRIEIAGGSSRLDQVGARLAAGSIVVEGDVGQRLGFAMAGGDIRVDGSAGPYAASAATAGTVRIAGNADLAAGGAVHGGVHGLNGATLVIGGEAGPRLGDRMRRGLIVARQAGEHAGCRMIAGTIVALGVGDNPGYGMKRGTLLTRYHGQLLPTFLATGRHRFVYLAVLRAVLHSLLPGPADLAGMADLAAAASGQVHRHAGDMAALGKGEILVP